MEVSAHFLLIPVNGRLRFMSTLSRDVHALKLDSRFNSSLAFKRYVAVVVAVAVVKVDRRCWSGCGLPVPAHRRGCFDNAVSITSRSLRSRGGGLQNCN